MRTIYGVLVSVTLAAIFMLPISAAAQDGEICLTCHGNEVAGLSAEDKSMYLEWKTSPHARMRVGCYDCHGGNVEGVTQEEIHSTMVDLKNPATAIDKCGVCHTGQLQAYKTAKHFIAVTDHKAAPSCITCHGARKAAALSVVEIPKLCETCHNAETKNHPEIPEKAAQIFELYKRIQIGIDQSTYNLLVDQRKGKDVASRLRDLQGIQGIVDDLSVTWHAFDLEKVQSTLQPLQVSLELVNPKPSLMQYVLMGLKALALILIIVVLGWWLVDRVRGDGSETDNETVAK